jgi:hypothetical protein
MLWLVRYACSPSINSLTLPAQELNGNKLVQTNLSWRIIADALIDRRLVLINGMSRSFETERDYSHEEASAAPHC